MSHSTNVDIFKYLNDGIHFWTSDKLHASFVIKDISIKKKVKPIREAVDNQRAWCTYLRFQAWATLYRQWWVEILAMDTPVARVISVTSGTIMRIFLVALSGQVIDWWSHIHWNHSFGIIWIPTGTSHKMDAYNKQSLFLGVKRLMLQGCSVSVMVIEVWFPFFHFDLNCQWIIHAIACALCFPDAQ